MAELDAGDVVLSSTGFDGDVDLPRSRVLSGCGVVVLGLELNGRDKADLAYPFRGRDRRSEVTEVRLRLGCSRGCRGRRRADGANRNCPELLTETAHPES